MDFEEIDRALHFVEDLGERVVQSRMRIVNRIRLALQIILQFETLGRVVGKARGLQQRAIDLSEALGRFPRQFDSLAINLLKAGEASGQMDGILIRIAELMAARLEQQAKIKSALFYPKIVGVLIIVVFVGVVGFIIPKFEGMFAKMGGELPLPTLVLIGLSKALTNYWYLMIIAVSAAIFGFKKWVATPDGRELFDRYVLKVPVFGTLLLQNDILSFCFILETLFRAGIQINESLNILYGTLANMTVRKDVDLIRQAIDAGETMSAGLSRGRTMPKLVINLVTIGEEAGEVEAALARLAAYYKLQMEHRMSTLSKAIEPILLSVIFGMVLVLALAVFLPMWKMNSLMKR